MKKFMIAMTLFLAGCHSHHKSTPTPGNLQPTLARINNGNQLSVSDIEALTAANISEERIIAAIQTTGSTFRLSPEQVDELKKHGVSIKVIDYMLQTGYLTP